MNSKVQTQNTLDGRQVIESEFRDALRTLEEENVISIFGNSRAPTIRFVV